MYAMVPALAVDEPWPDGRAGVTGAGRSATGPLLEVSTPEVTGGRSIAVEVGGFV